MATTDTTRESLEDFRVAMLEELGFTKEQSILLSEAQRTCTVKGVKGAPNRYYSIRVDHHYVRGLLDRGATTEQVLRILT
jgi:hypothetical protein